MKLPAWDELADDYSRYHQTRGNRLCHMVGIPLIVMAVLGAARWPGTPVPVAAAVLPVYFFWDIRLALKVSAMIAALSWAAALLPGPALLAAFALGWAFQFAGHALYEGRSPAFTRNLVHLLVGPAWILQRHPPARSGAA